MFMPAFKFRNLPIFSLGMSASTSSPVERILDLVALEPLARLYIMFGKSKARVRSVSSVKSGR
jgi:hypothetical protein